MTSPSRSAGFGKCVHCLFDRDRNWDHVFPESWYPQGLNSNFEKPVAPSCVECNTKLGKLESTFISRIALSLDRHDERSRDVVERALRSFDESKGKNEKDRTARRRRMESLMHHSVSAKNAPLKSAFPGLGPSPQRRLEGNRAYLIPHEWFDGIASKFLKGYVHSRFGWFIGDKEVLEFHPYKWEMGDRIDLMLGREGYTDYVLPAFRVRWVVAAEAPPSGVFEFELFGQVRLYASILRAES